MADFKAIKHVGNLPTGSAIEPDCVYLHRIGDGFDLYCSNKQGNALLELNQKAADATIYPLIPDKTLVVPGAGNTSDENYAFRNFILINPDNSGWIKVDFKLLVIPNNWWVPIFNYPPECPRCVGLPEEQFFDGTTVFSADRTFQNDNLSKKVMCGAPQDMTLNRRYIKSFVARFESEP